MFALVCCSTVWRWLCDCKGLISIFPTAFCFEGKSSQEGGAWRRLKWRSSFQDGPCVLQLLSVSSSAKKCVNVSMQTQFFLSLSYVLIARHQDTNYTYEIHSAEHWNFFHREEISQNSCSSLHEGRTMHLRHLHVLSISCWPKDQTSTYMIEP